MTSTDGYAGEQGAESRPPATGHPRIDQALDALAAFGDALPDQLVAPLTEADRALRETLDSIRDD